MALFAFLKASFCGLWYGSILNIYYFVSKIVSKLYIKGDSLRCLCFHQLA